MCEILSVRGVWECGYSAAKRGLSKELTEDLRKPINELSEPFRSALVNAWNHGYELALITNNK